MFPRLNKSEFGAAYDVFRKLFRGGDFGCVLREARPKQRHFQQNRVVVGRIHLARQLYALSGEMPIRITPFHYGTSPTVVTTVPLRSQ